jgi:hypothetical protein
MSLSPSHLLERLFGLNTRDARGLGGRIRRLEKWLAFHRPRLKVYNGHDMVEFQMRAQQSRPAPPVALPMLLVAQVQRSGGSLLMQLLDGHPSLQCYPNELDRLKGRGPDGWARWLDSKPAAAEIVDPWVWTTRNGYSKMSGSASHLRDDHTYTLPFYFSWDVFRAVYGKASAEAAGGRQVLQAYFTAFFAAWLNNTNISGDKQRLVAFAPGALDRGQSDVDAFLDFQGDGKIVGLVRDPFSWYASASKHSSKYGPLPEAIGLWSRQTEVLLDAAKQAPQRVRVFLFQDLLTDPAETTGQLCDWLGVPRHPSTALPSFNGQPFWSNSSFEVIKGEVKLDPLNRAKESLSPQEIEQIGSLAGALWDRVQVEQDRTPAQEQGQAR